MRHTHEKNQHLILALEQAGINKEHLILALNVANDDINHAISKGCNPQEIVDTAPAMIAGSKLLLILNEEGGEL